MANNLKRAIDVDLSRLRTTERERAVILTNALEGHKVKKKLSVAFVLAMTLVLLAAAALAVVTIQETGRIIAQNEQELGDYIDWPAEKKAAVVRELIDEGYIADTPERGRLRDGALAQDELARVADEAIAELTGEDARYASFLGIMNAVWGPFEDWSDEQKAWYSQVMTDVGAETDGKTYYVTPTGPMTGQEAVAIAKREIARGFGMDEALLDKYRVFEVSYQVPEFAEPGDTKAYWYVAMDTWHTELDGQEGLPFNAIDVFVDPDTGELLEPIEEKVKAWDAARARSEHPLYVALRAFEQSVNEPKAFRTWTLEHKARWSAEMAPQIKQYFAENGDDNELLLGYTMKAAMLYTYGLPDDKAIPQERALDIAREALRSAYGLSDEELALLFDLKGAFYEPCLFYDVTDPERPLWKFFLSMPSVYDSDDAVVARVKVLYGVDTEYDRFYKAELDARTGEVLRTLSMRYLPDDLAGYADIY